MKGKKNILYLVDDYLLLYAKNKQKIYKYKVANKALKNGKIASTKLFMKSYQKFLQTNKLNNNLFGDAITIIINPSFTKVDIDIITNVFASLNYRKVNIINEMKIYKFNNTNAYLNYNEKYLIMAFINEYKEKEIYLIENDLMDTQDLIKIIGKRIKNRDIFCFGLNKNIEEFIMCLENKTNNTCYHFKNDETYLIEEIIL